MKPLTSPILIDVQREIIEQNRSKDLRLKGLTRMLNKLTRQLGHDPTDEDLRRIGKTRLLDLADGNDTERNIAWKIARRFE